MCKKISVLKKGISSFIIYPAIAIWLFSGCATPSSSVAINSDEAKGPVIEQIKVSPSPLETVVEITNSRYTPYTAFKLADPPRVILDIRGTPSGDLPQTTKINDENLLEISFEEGKTQAMTTRMVANLARQVDYQVVATDNVIRLTLTKKQLMPEAKEQIEPKASPVVQEKKEPVEAKEPRIFLKPRSSDLNQVLGIDFTMLDHGKSRLTVTTDKKVRYDLNRKGTNSLVLRLTETTIPPLLLREIDTAHFKTALDRVKPAFSSAKKEVSLDLFLREMVPFHVKPTDTGLDIDFGPTSVKPPEKKIIPLELAEVQTRALAAERPSSIVKMVGAEPAPLSVVPGRKKAFTCEKMYLDFINADVTHILRLINEVSKDNIIWDPVIKGQKVSMILKDVPWDEALELILKNNALAKRYVGKNIIWITTKAKMKQLEAEERAEEKRLEAERKKQEAAEKQAKKDTEKEAEEKEPLITEYLPVDFGKASEIKGFINLSESGKKRGASLNTDTRTNTIIIKDIASSIEEAKKTVTQFDTPVKQVIIEARIVDATNSFSRDLGLRWNTNTSAYRSNRGTVTSADDITLTATGERVYGGSFSTNDPKDQKENWGNIGLNFSRLTSSGLGALTLDARLALAESEGTAKTLSAPKVIATEGSPATITSGEIIKIPATENVASEEWPATLSLNVTPSSISYNDYITLTISVSDDQRVSDSLKTTKTIDTTLMVKSGETVVIGGIIKETEGEDVTGVPVLKDLPVLGWLFKAKSRSKKRTELLIFLTPTVMPSPVKSF